MKITAPDQRSMRHQVLVAPPMACIPSAFERVRVSSPSRESLLAGMQRLRGDVYLRDGAIRPDELTSDGRHYSSTDDVSWHLLTVEGSRVVACVRFLVHSNDVPFHQLTLSRAALARSPEWGPRLLACVEREMRRARTLNIPFVEIGGWALADHVRHSTEAARIALGAFAFGQLFGGAVGISTATMRNHSAVILSRMGGQALRHQGMELPVYYDPQYECDMAILRFDAYSCAPKYHSMVGQLTDSLAYAPVYCDHAPQRVRYAHIPISQPAAAWATFAPAAHAQTA